MGCLRTARCRANALPLAAAFALLAAGTALAQSEVWSTRGPSGGNIRCIVPDPSDAATLYAGTDDGVFKSSDGGHGWSASDSGLPADRVQAIAVDSRAPSTLYAGTLTPNGVPSDGIFKSTDGGATWTAMNNGLVDTVTGTTPLDVRAIALDPSQPATLLAGARFSDIFKSTDGGATWVPKTFGGFNVQLEVSAFQYDPSTPSRIYAASTSGLLLSIDGGETWNGYGDLLLSFFALVLDPTTPATLYAGNTTGYGIYKSIDRGAHWTQSNTGLPDQGSLGAGLPIVIALAVDPSAPSTVYAGTAGDGLFQSTDAGATWAPIDDGLRSAYVSALLLSSGSSPGVLAGTLGAGIYRSTDAGGTWAASKSGLNQGLISSLVADSTTPDTLFAGTFEGVSVSSDGGASWQPAVDGLPVAPVATLALQPGPDGTLFAGTLGDGLFRSSDGGASWTAAAGPADLYISALAIDPSNAAVLYAGTSHPTDGTQSQRIYKSSDAGVTWTQTGLDAQSLTITSIVVNPANAAQVLAISQGQGGYFQSKDSGASWTTMAVGAQCGGVNAILFDGSTMFLGGTAGVCRSTDGGLNWAVHAVAAAGASVQTLMLDPADPGILYAGASPGANVNGTGGVFQSADGGQTWQTVGTGLGSNVTVTSLAKDSNGSALHAGIYGGGVADLSLVPPERPPIEPAAPGDRQTRVVGPR